MECGFPCRFNFPDGCDIRRLRPSLGWTSVMGSRGNFKKPIYHPLLPVTMPSGIIEFLDDLNLYLIKLKVQIFNLANIYEYLWLSFCRVKSCKAKRQLLLRYYKQRQTGKYLVVKYTSTYVVSVDLDIYPAVINLGI